MATHPDGGTALVFFLVAVKSLPPPTLWPML